ncbi:sulfatase-like hydrolase/transferase [Lacrimispora sp. 38-1]|uniref:sulfatase-like hydrolase/transferase n=1 Tax=Lacrimispora sp. 38-1 TaxID=3125778 RepID=UPI003CFBAFAF
MKQRPNFIVIHTDQHRFDCVGINNRRKGIYTPYLDTIGNMGANFTACYSNCPLCIPQRMSFLTGLTPEHHGLLSNIGIPYFPMETSLPTEMRRGSYQTAMVGRTMHTYPANESYGFEYYLPGDPSSENKDTTDAFFKYLRDNNSDETGGYYGNGINNNSRAAAPFHLSDEFHQSKWTVNRAMDFLDNHDPSRPFMLFVGFYAPHSPHNPPVEYFNRYYNREDLDNPAIGDWEIPPVNSGNFMSSYINLKDEELRAARAGYYGNISFLDAQVGRLLTNPMIAFGCNTYVIFTSDHGEMLGDHYMYHKSRPYEGSSHLPLCIMGPGISDNQTIDAPVGWHDLMPTILDLAGLEIPSSVDGRSIAPLLRGEGTSTPWRKYMHGETVHNFFGEVKTRPVDPRHNFYYEKGTQYLTDGKIKYIWHITSGLEQLFDLSSDPNELHDLSQEQEWQSVLEKWRADLVKELENRPEGFSDGKDLIPGREVMKVSPEIDKLIDQRQAEGFRLAYTFGGKNPIAKMEYENNLMN